jgi:hypothetical protein
MRYPGKISWWKQGKFVSEEELKLILEEFDEDGNGQFDAVSFEHNAYHHLTYSPVCPNFTQNFYNAFTADGVRRNDSNICGHSTDGLCVCDPRCSLKARALAAGYSEAWLQTVPIPRFVIFSLPRF